MQWEFYLLAIWGGSKVLINVSGTLKLLNKWILSRRISEGCGTLEISLGAREKYARWSFGPFNSDFEDFFFHLPFLLLLTGFIELTVPWVFRCFLPLMEIGARIQTPTNCCHYETWDTIAWLSYPRDHNVMFYLAFYLGAFGQII